MVVNIEINKKKYTINLLQPIDISLPLSASDKNPIAWYLDKPIISPVTNGDWIGKVSEGKSSTNFNNIYFNPHGHGTHTECLGHITKDFYSINDCLKTFFFLSKLVSITPEKVGDDLIIQKHQLEELLHKNKIESLIIRTLPNLISKKEMNYSNTNPPYLSQEAAVYIHKIGIKHLLIDLPSVDKEYDDGKLLAHKAFWNVTNLNDLNADARLGCTITEMIYVANTVKDGEYLLNLQIASFENDASPSKPVLYKMLKF